MEHILNPLSPARPHTEVLFLGAYYDGEEFYDFPDRMGLSEEDVVNGNFGSWTVAESAGFLQAWLFFGVIHQIVNGGLSGCTADITDPLPIVGPYEFIKKREGKPDLVCTSRLNLRLQQWYQRIRSMSPASKAKSGKFIEKNLLFARHMAKKYLQSDGTHWGVWPLDETTIMSILILYSTLGSFASLIYDQINFDVTKFGRSPLLDRQLESSGSPLITNFHVRLCHAYYLSRLYWPHFEDCESQGRLRGRETSVENYTTKHVAPGCDCNFISVDTNELQNTILHGFVPLLKVDLLYTARNGLQPTLTLESFNPKTENRFYVAISHVWIDGLGNRGENALPECQLISLTQMVSDTVEMYAIGSRGYAIFERRRVLFWLDTLCVPINRNLEDLALRNMKDIYEKAAATLVLDRGLMSTSIKRPTLRASKSGADYKFARAAEVLARITTSAWFQRLWTLQEAVSSISLYIQFSDCQVIPIREAQRIEDAGFPYSEDPDRFDLVGEEFAAKYSYVMKGRIDGAISEQKLFLLNGALRSRYTAKWEDESTCVATILGINLDVVFQVQPEDRIAAILKTFTDLPGGIAFDPGPRYDEEGMGWAPKSLLRLSSPVVANRGTLGSKGFTIETVGIVRPYAKWRRNISVLRSWDDTERLMWAVPKYGEFQTTAECQTDEEASKALAERIERHYSNRLDAGREEFAIIVHPSEIDQIDQIQSHTNCLMLNITDRTPELISGRVVCHVKIFPFSMAQYVYNEDLAELFELVSGERTERDQKWCLS